MNNGIKRIFMWLSAAAFAVGVAGCAEEGFDDSLNPATVFVAGGSFMMGCTSEQDDACDENEMPAREASVEDFYIGVAQVTQLEWARLMGTTVIEVGVLSANRGDYYPMHGVSWNEANQYVKKLSNRTGKKYRLLTEAEWEYAARGGNLSGGYKYSGSDNIGDVAWYSGNSGNRVRETCKKAGNELGVCDMSGNVREWVDDKLSNGDRVFRGGSWSTAASECRVSARNGASPSNRNKYIGFRVAMSPGG